MNKNIKISYKRGLLRYMYNGRTIFFDQVDPSEVQEKIKQLNKEVKCELELTLPDSSMLIEDLLDTPLDTTEDFFSEDNENSYTKEFSCGSCLIFCVLFILILYGIGHLLL